MTAISVSPTTRRERLDLVRAVIACPTCGHVGPDFTPDPALLDEATGTLACGPCGSRYEVRDGIIDLLPGGPDTLTLAQWTGQTQAVSYLYERIWRKNALGLMSGEEFPPEREHAMLRKALEVPLTAGQPGIFLDLACSTGYYGRAMVEMLAQGLPGGAQASVVVGLDLSMPMLEQNRAFARAAGADDRMVWVRADASRQPFASKSVLGIACGGTLNEYRNAASVLAESRRVLIPEIGRYFVMNLLEATNPLGRLARRAMTAGSGLSFFTRASLDEMFAAAGLSILHKEDHGLVAFTELAA